MIGPGLLFAALERWPAEQTRRGVQRAPSRLVRPLAAGRRPGSTAAPAARPPRRSSPAGSSPSRRIDGISCPISRSSGCRGCRLSLWFWHRFLESPALARGRSVLRRLRPARQRRQLPRLSHSLSPGRAASSCVVMRAAASTDGLGDVAAPVRGVRGVRGAPAGSQPALSDSRARRDRGARRECRGHLGRHRDELHHPDHVEPLLQALGSSASSGPRTRCFRAGYAALWRCLALGVAWRRGCMPDTTRASVGQRIGLADRSSLSRPAPRRSRTCVPGEARTASS